MPPRTRTQQFSCSTLSLLLCTLFCAFKTCVSCITFFLGLAASHSSKDPPSLAYWLFASPQLISVRWCCRGRAKRENVPPPENHSLCVLTRLELKIALFCLFPLLASVVLLYCFTCLCPEEGVYVVCESWRKVIQERLQRQNETHTKDEAKWNKNKTPHLRLRRRRGRVASEDNSNHPPFCFRRQLPSKQKEMSCYSGSHLFYAKLWTVADQKPMVKKIWKKYEKSRDGLPSSPKSKTGQKPFGILP